ncbi:hypothetical protein FUAX_25970 [Fulvitalea axinellae]|uniref:Toxin-antitoxin system YwqK family antitoxin n=1 Tax=Fulvitalea axinellae TaxID=1182444 RepID=A0AAU9DGK5_9BACT|nr:hypothetical protein FUAX_25970 [Fulvitalea axinellae]
MKKYLLILALSPALFFSACQGPSKSKEKKEAKTATVDEKGRKHGLRKIMAPDGKTLKSTVNYNHGKKHGKAKTYYADGKVKTEIDYFNNVKHGDSKWFHQNGKLYRLTTFNNGKKHGPRKTYGRDGKMLAEMNYHEGFLKFGTKEFMTTGKERTKFPKIVITPENNLASNNTYSLHIKLSQPRKKFKVYVGKLKGADHVNPKKSQVKDVTVVGGIATFDVTIPKNKEVNELLDVVVEYSTRMGNPRLDSRKYRLKASNF